MKNILTLIAGIGIGVAISWTYNKNKYEEMVQEEVESLREMNQSKKEPMDAEEDQGKTSQEKMWEESKKAKEKAQHVDIGTQKEKEVFDKDLNNVKTIINYNHYSQEKEDKEEIKEKSSMVIIKPEEFADKIGYDTDSFYLFADNIITDDNNTAIDNVEETLGFTVEEIRTQLGVYENDAVYIRNPKLKMDYEVLRELDTYQKRDGD